METKDDDDRCRTKKRLIDKLKSAIGGLVIATASLATPSAEASVAPETKQTPSLEERISQLPKQTIATTEHSDSLETMLAFGNWGNHWANWQNWKNWANWHNHR